MPFFVWRAAACKDINISEVWYDAEEDLEPSRPAAAAGTGRTPQVITKDATNGRWSVNAATALWLQICFVHFEVLSVEFVVTTESTSEEAKRSVLCVSNLPRNVTEVCLYSNISK